MLLQTTTKSVRLGRRTDSFSTNQNPGVMEAIGLWGLDEIVGICRTHGHDIVIVRQ